MTVDLSNLKPGACVRNRKGDTLRYVGKSLFYSWPCEFVRIDPPSIDLTTSITYTTTLEGIWNYNFEPSDFDVVEILEIQLPHRPDPDTDMDPDGCPKDPSGSVWTAKISDDYVSNNGTGFWAIHQQTTPTLQ